MVFEIAYHSCFFLLNQVSGADNFCFFSKFSLITSIFCLSAEQNLVYANRLYMEAKIFS